MKTVDRKAARAASKERKTIAGIYAVRCGVTAQVWVGQTPNLDTIRNRIWFTLHQGSNPHHSLQSAWTSYGSQSFTFEELERLDNEGSSYVRDALLKEGAVYWRAKLDALAI